MQINKGITKQITITANCLILLLTTLIGCSKKDKDSSSSPIAANNSASDGILISKLEKMYGFAIASGDQKQMTVGIKPENATNKAVKWSTSDDTIAEIDPETGLLYAKSAGSVKVTVTALDGSGISNSCTVWVVSATAEWENLPHRKVNQSFPFYLYYEKDAFTISVYAPGDDGYYSYLVKIISCSRGRTVNMTPTGIFKINKRKRWYQFSIGKYWTQYCIRYSGDIYLHGPLYRKMSGDTMHINEYNQIGTPSTSGCLAMTTADIKWIWDNCPNGTTLEIVAGSPVGMVAPAPQRIPLDGPAIDPSDPAYKETE
ncbi:MAG: Ig-like domain-containing protein [Oscillospiraceae bacterium]|nr:Ig-like domain-containing protein [Oscillospiraceae bacterium]